MSARYEGNAEFNARHPGQNRYGQTLGMEIHIPFISESLRGLDLRIIESFAYVPELPAFSYVAGADSLPREANGGVQTGRIQTLRNRAGVLVGYGWTPRISTSLSYSNVITRYQGGALEDVTVHEGGLTGGYRASRQMQWTISYLGSITDYQRSDSVTVHRFTLGNLYQFSPTFAVNLGTGVAVTAGAGAQWTVNAGLTKTEENGSISLQYTRGIGTGGGLTTTATLSQNLIAQINRVLARSTTGFFSLGYGMNDTLSGPTQKIRTQEIGTGIQMTLRSWLSGGINYSYLDQRAEGGATIQDTRRNQVMVTLTAAALPLRIMQ